MGKWEIKLGSGNENLNDAHLHVHSTHSKLSARYYAGARFGKETVSWSLKSGGGDGF